MPCCNMLTNGQQANVTLLVSAGGAAVGETGERGKALLALLDVQDVTVRFGGIMALDSLAFDIGEGQICALIGPNGAGKTTMFNVVSRIYQPNSGVVLFDSDNLLDVDAHAIARHGVARTFQNLALFPRLTVLENVMVGAHSRCSINFLT